jgi:hypothetical protein
VRATARKAKSKRLAAVPVLTVELPAAFSPELVAAVDAVGAVIQPFFTGAVDTSQKRCGRGTQSTAGMEGIQPSSTAAHAGKQLLMHHAWKAYRQ